MFRGRPSNNDRAGPNTRCQVRLTPLPILRLFPLYPPSSARLWTRMTLDASTHTRPNKQKCLKYGHFTYECKNARPYVPRPSRTSQLAEGGGPKERVGVSMPDDIASKAGVADKILKAKEEARKRLAAEEEKERRAIKKEKQREERRERARGKLEAKRRKRSYVLSDTSGLQVRCPSWGPPGEGGPELIDRPSSSESDSDSMSSSYSESDRPRRRYSSSPEPDRRDRAPRRRYSRYSSDDSPPRQRGPARNDKRSASPARRRSPPPRR